MLAPGCLNLSLILIIVDNLQGHQYRLYYRSSSSISLAYLILRSLYFDLRWSIQARGRQLCLWWHLFFLRKGRRSLILEICCAGKALEKHYFLENVIRQAYDLLYDSLLGRWRPALAELLQGLIALKRFISSERSSVSFGIFYTISYFE